MSSFSNFTLLIKKMARKSSIGRKLTTQRLKRTRTQRHASTTIANTRAQEQDLASVSTCSSNEVDTGDPDQPSTTSPKLNSDSKVEPLGPAALPRQDEIKTESVRTVDSIRSCRDTHKVLIRDFAYSESSPLHFGQAPIISPYNVSDISISSSRFNGRHAKALYDFRPETKDEVAMKCGQVVWIQDRQCPGWLIADVDDETGLVPESYIEFV